MPIERIRHIALLFQLKAQFAWVPVFVCARILIAIHWHSGGGKVACTGQFGQIAEVRHRDVNR